MKKLLKFCTSLFCAVLLVLTVAACKPEVVKVESISVKTNPTKLIYKINESFSADGLVISAHNSDGTDTDLTSSDYTIDSSGFINSEAGSYVINVILNDDNSKICDFNVTVEPLVLTGISLKEGYDNVFILYENVKLKEMNLTVIESYDDGSKIEISGDDLLRKYNVSIDTYKKGINKKATVKSNSENITFTCDLTYTVCDMEDLNVKEFKITKAPSITTLAFENRFYVSNYFLDTEYEVRFIESPNRKYTLGFNDVDLNYSKVENAEEPGKYNVRVSFQNKSVDVEFTLLDISEYVLNSIKADTKDTMLIYFLNEEIYDSYFLDTVLLLGTYKKDGSPDLVIPYNPQGTLTVDTTELTDTVGTKTIKILEDDVELCSFNVEVVNFNIEDGTYLYDNGGYYMYGFKVENSSVSFYSYEGEWISSEFLHFYRMIYDDEPSIVAQYSNYYSIPFDKDAKLSGYKKLESTDVKVTFDLVGSKTVLFFANGEAGDEFINTISQLGELHLGSKNGEVIEDLSKFTFTNGCEIYVVYQQDATGQPFLGNYTNSQSGYYLVVKANGVDLYAGGKQAFLSGEKPTSVMEYRYTIENDIVHVTLQNEEEVVIDLDKNELTIDNLVFTLDR